MAITEKQLVANQNNSKLGGVKTDHGKAVSRLNALKHGLLSKEVLLEGEDEQSLSGLVERLRDEINPSGEVENLLVDRVIANVWRLKRLLTVEKAMMEWQREEELSNSWTFEKGEEHGNKKAAREMLVNDDIEKLMRYETGIEKSIYKALHELQRLQAVRAGEKLPAPIAIDVDISKDE